MASRRWWATVIVALIALSGACGDGVSTAPTSTAGPLTSTTTTTAPTTTAPTSTAPTTTAVPSSTAPVEQIVVSTYFSREGLLAAGSRKVAKTDALRAAIAAAVEGPNRAERAAGFTSAIPSGTTLRGVNVVNRHAEVDLSSAFTTGGGSLSIRLRVAQIVYTVVRLGIADSVRFLIDGQRVESIGGEGLIVTDVKVGEFDDLLPPILIEFPTPGATVSSGFHFRGLANVFEGHVRYELLDARSSVVTSGFATGMMGAWGEFDATVTMAPGTTGPCVFVVFTISPKDGARRDETRIEVIAS